MASQVMCLGFTIRKSPIRRKRFCTEVAKAGQCAMLANPQGSRRDAHLPREISPILSFVEEGLQQRAVLVAQPGKRVPHQRSAFLGHDNCQGIW